jgi:hypothetical protein
LAFCIVNITYREKWLWGQGCIEKRRLMGMIIKPTEFKMYSSMLKAKMTKESFLLAEKCQSGSDAEYYSVAVIFMFLST